MAALLALWILKDCEGRPSGREADLDASVPWRLLEETKWTNGKLGRNSKFKLPMKRFAPLWSTLLAACTVAASSDQAAPKPNILFILVDDLGYAEVGFNRDVPDAEVKTPNVDSLVCIM